jgi:hypothetical protein
VAKTIGEWGKPSTQATKPAGNSPKRAPPQRTDSRAIIEARLQPGEKLLWHGRGSGLNVTAGNVYALGFLAIWSAFAFTGLVRAILQNDQDPWLLAYILVIFIAVAVLLGGLALRSLFAPAHETYGVTDRRVIIFRNIYPRHTTSYPGKDLDFILPGARNVRLCKQKRGAFHPIALIGIERPAEIAELIRTTLRPDLKPGEDPDMRGIPPLEPRRPPP